MAQRLDKDSLPLDKPRRTPDHPTKSHVVKTRVDGKEKIIRFGEQGAKTAGKPKEGESEAMKQKRASFKARHAKNIAKGKSSPAYWADKVKWATGGSVSLEDLDEQYEGIKKPDFTLLESFRQLIRDLQARAEESGTQEFDPLRALGRSGAAESLEDLYASYADEKVPHAARVEAGARDPKRTETAKMVFDSFKAAGFSDAQAKALTAEINREGGFNPAFLFGTHTDAANKATNVGMLSWQGDRANRLMSFMADRGLIDPSGRITPGQDALNAQAEYLRWEMENDPSYTRTRETFLANPEIDPETAHEILGKNFIRWRIDDPAYRGSGFDRIYEGYDLLNMAQGYAEGGLAELAHKYDKGGKKKDDEDELARAARLRDQYFADMPKNPNAVPAEDPRLLNVGGLEERLAFLNQTLNPVEAIGDAMSAGRDLMASEAGGYDRLEALGRMLSGVAGVAGPAAVAKRIGAPAATAVMESLLGGSPTAEAVADMARKYAVDESGALKLYHGSPHDFDRFSMSKIGTGEGAQAYGHGLYFTETPDIGRGYRDNVFGAPPRDAFSSDEAHEIVSNQLQGFGATPNALYDATEDLRKSLSSAEASNKIWKDQQPRVDALKEAIAYLENKADTRLMVGDKSVSDIYDALSSRADRLPIKAAQTNYDKMAILEDLMNDGDVLGVMQRKADYDPAALAWFEKEIAPKFKRSGALYEVEVNANPEDFLDWDKPLSEQPKKVQEAFSTLGTPERLASVQGENAYRALSSNLGALDWPIGADAATRRQFYGQGAANASEALREAGIPGIRYLDAGSRGAGDGSRNYVIFDENLINIVRKYGIAGAAAMLGVSAADVEQAMAQGSVEDLDQKYAEGGKVNTDNPYDILNLEPDAFVGALDELGMQGEERKFLMDQYFAKSRALPMTDRPEGKTVRTILPIATPEGMSGYEALMSGDFEFAVPEILRGIYEAPAEAINVAAAIGRGVPVTEDQVREAGMAVPEFMAGVAPVRAITINGGRLGALDYDPTVTRAFTGPGKAYERRGAEIAERLRDTTSVGDVLGLEPEPVGAGFTEIGSKQPRILGEHTSTGIMSDELEAPEPETFSNLIGRDLLSIVGDNTGRHIVTGVKGRELENPVKSMAGFEYIDVPGQGYAGAQSAQSGKLNEALASEDPFLISVMMAEKSGDFARHTGNVYGEMAKFAEIASKDVEKVDEAIRNISQPIKRKVVMPDGSVKMVGETIKPFTDFPSVKDPNAIYNYINSLPTGTQRAYFLKGLDRAMFEKAGLPSVADARLAVADARQLGMDWGATGYRGFTPDLEKGLLKTTPEQSTTYDTGIDKIGKSKTLIGEGMGIPANLVFRDLAAEMRAKGTGGRLAMTSPDYKVYESSPKRAKQRVDTQLGEMLDTFIEIEKRFGRDMAMRYANDLLSGDKITGEMMTSARRAYAPGFAEGGKVNTDDELERAILLRDLELMAEERSPDAVPAQDPSLLNVGGVGDRLALINKYLNPVEAIGESMDAGSRMMSPDASGYERVAALGDMLSGVAGVAGPAAVAKRVGAPAASAVADMARKYAVDEAGSLPGMGSGQPERFGENWNDVYHWSRSPEGFSEFDPDKSKSAMSQLGPHVGTQGAAEARYMGFANPDETPAALGFTMPLKADLSKPFLNPATGKPWTEMDLEMFISAVSDVNNIDRKLVAPFMRERLAKEGYTSIPYMNDVEDAGSVSHIMLTERPANSDAVLRSRFAKFDPAMRNAKNLSAGVAAGAIGASQYDPDAIEATAARVRENKFAAGGAVKYDPGAVDRTITKLREVNRG